MLEYDEIAAQFEKGQKINYDLILQRLVAQWQQEDQRPRMLLHSCCAPCSTYTLEYLTQYADITVFYDNPNIHPRAEFERRRAVQEKFIKDFNANTGNDVQFIAGEYEPSKWLTAVKGFEQEPEKGLRCQICFTFRLDRVAAKAQELGFEYFGSALTISPSKNSALINQLGLEIQHVYDVAYLPSDFKKRQGYKRSLAMCDEYDIYRQCYCGCIFAAKQQGIDLAKVNKEATAYLKANNIKRM